MFIKQHILVGTLAATAASWCASPQAGLAVFAGNVLIDADHYLWYALQFRDGSLKRARRFFEAKEADHYYCLCVLHTLEAIAIYVACALLLRGTFFWIATGCIMHMTSDIIHSMNTGGLSLRKWS